MMKLALMLVGSVAFCGAALGADTEQFAPNISAAIDNPARPAEDKARDADRKPGDMLTFAGVKVGDQVADLIPGGGYFTRLFSKAVGNEGHVYAVFPTEGDAARAKRGNALPGANAAFPNVSIVHEPLVRFAVPLSLDVVWTSQNYHDLHDPNMGKPDMAAVNRAIFAALKPGGVYIVLDHAAEAGSGLRDTDTLHRIDEATVKSEVEAAGFVLDGESDALRNPADSHTAKVFDPAIRGHTDQFILKFRKPG